MQPAIRGNRSIDPTVGFSFITVRACNAYLHESENDVPRLSAIFVHDTVPSSVPHLSQAHLVSLTDFLIHNGIAWSSGFPYLLFRHQYCVVICHLALPFIS